MAEPGKYVYEYPRPMVVTDAIVFTVKDATLEVLLIQRGHDPWKGSWALPGGFVEMDESLDVAAARELAEESSVRGVELVQFHTFGQVDRDPRGRVITVAFIGVTDWQTQHPRHGDDAADVAWVPVEDLPQLACDHNQIVEHAVRCLHRLLALGELDFDPGSVSLAELRSATASALKAH